MLKSIGLILILFVSCCLTAQTYTRGNKNWGGTLGIDTNFHNTSQKLFKELHGFNASIGIITNVFDFIYPSLLYKHQKQSIVTAYSTCSEYFSLHNIAIPIRVKIPLLGINKGKSNKYEYKGIETSGILGPEYDFNLSNSSDNLQSENSFFICADLGFVPIKNNGSKGNQKWHCSIDKFIKV